MARPEIPSRERAADVVEAIPYAPLGTTIEDLLTEQEERALRLAFMRDDCFWSTLRSLLFAIAMGSPIWKGLEH